ncbi:hypothetical protein PTSG_10940 [Salpingoeca rosetta]|uniref:MYND-type domain-containing protein n=1 Tax=Salpingoeca rosetta (strain ATCC 50818 / BSB-021) TaxID=946362 RepID=F2US87_SALR5|nr:uncharacterized protein PTSG_10940 [Salpingoeca rosetta]EGD80996.1 hypothetical protein PTSG_10940 [Salpingoeca rosetta]|eukprot:XP_004987866.1 hypothetical protein PTSG_10940 [Salpingoeca rosetta]
MEFGEREAMLTKLMQSVASCKGCSKKGFWCRKHVNKTPYLRSTRFRLQLGTPAQCYYCQRVLSSNLSVMRHMQTEITRLDLNKAGQIVSPGFRSGEFGWAAHDGGGLLCSSKCTMQHHYPDSRQKPAGESEAASVSATDREQVGGKHAASLLSSMPSTTGPAPRASSKSGGDGDEVVGYSIAEQHQVTVGKDARRQASMMARDVQTSAIQPDSRDGARAAEHASTQASHARQDRSVDDGGDGGDGHDVTASLPATSDAVLFDSAITPAEELTMLLSAVTHHHRRHHHHYHHRRRRRHPRRVWQSRPGSGDGRAALLTDGDDDDGGEYDDVAGKYDDDDHDDDDDDDDDDAGCGRGSGAAVVRGDDGAVTLVRTLASSKQQFEGGGLQERTGGNRDSDNHGNVADVGQRQHEHQQHEHHPQHEHRQHEHQQQHEQQRPQHDHHHQQQQQQQHVPGCLPSPSGWVRVLSCEEWMCAAAPRAAWRRQYEVEVVAVLQHTHLRDDGDDGGHDEVSASGDNVGGGGGGDEDEAEDNGCDGDDASDGAGRLRGERGDGEDDRVNARSNPGQPESGTVHDGAGSQQRPDQLLPVPMEACSDGDDDEGDLPDGNEQTTTGAHARAERDGSVDARVAGTTADGGGGGLSEEAVVQMTGAQRGVGTGGAVAAADDMTALSRIDAHVREVVAAKAGEHTASPQPYVPTTQHQAYAGVGDDGVPQVRVPACVLCGQHAEFCCTGCYQAYYCSPACQRQHWGEHKLCCTYAVVVNESNHQHVQ